MRDKERIRPFLEKFAEFWDRYPDWRFSQVFLNLTRNEDGVMQDPWEWEEEDFIFAIDKFKHELDMTLEELKKRLVSQMDPEVVKMLGPAAIHHLAEAHYNDMHPHPKDGL